MKNYQKRRLFAEKLRQARLNQVPQTSEQAYAQMERMNQPPKKRK